MNGYSVTEAASVLGVPTERVWELLARGVLAGRPDGETGMRVFLQPRPAPATPAAETPRANGGSASGTREPERELSPFRELLTEFRNLTERYGQALLALGEARGEVAALRSRVDLLEARMELRLPPGTSAQGPAATAWSPRAAPVAPEQHAAPARDVFPTSADAERPAPDAGTKEQVADAVDHPRGEDDDEDRPVRRRRGQRRPTESFAAALARAEDPTAAELPGAKEAAAALAALRREADAAEVGTGDVSLPRELPAAEPMARIEDAPLAVTAAALPERNDTAVTAEQEDVRPAEAAPAAPEPLVAEAGPDAQPPANTWDQERYTAEIADPDWFAAEDTFVREESRDTATMARTDAIGADTDEHGSAPRAADAEAAEAESRSAQAESEAAEEMEVAAFHPVPEGRPVTEVPDAEVERPWRAEPGVATPRRRATPAARAYRRLRRIFPG